MSTGTAFFDAAVLCCAVLFCAVLCGAAGGCTLGWSVARASRGAPWPACCNLTHASAAVRSRSVPWRAPAHRVRLCFHSSKSAAFVVVVPGCVAGSCATGSAVTTASSPVYGPDDMLNLLGTQAFGTYCPSLRWEGVASATLPGTDSGDAKPSRPKPVRVQLQSSTRDLRMTSGGLAIGSPFLSRQDSAMSPVRPRLVDPTAAQLAASFLHHHPQQKVIVDAVARTVAQVRCGVFVCACGPEVVAVACRSVRRL